MSSLFCDLALRPVADLTERSGGLSTTHKGEAAIRAALSCLGKPQDDARAASPSPTPSSTINLNVNLNLSGAGSTPLAYALWVSDEGWLYPPALHHRNLPLSKLLMVHVREAKEVWRLALEAISTGLFGWTFLRPSQLCSTGNLRKLQLTAESSRCEVIILGEQRLPHWVLKKTAVGGGLLGR